MKGGWDGDGREGFGMRRGIEGLHRFRPCTRYADIPYASLEMAVCTSNRYGSPPTFVGPDPTPLPVCSSSSSPTTPPLPHSP